MNEVILHIGMHKTGTTSIQKSLSGFDDGKTIYANLGPENHSFAIYTIFSAQRYNYHWKSMGFNSNSIDLKKENFLNLLIEELTRTDRKRIIISGEDIAELTCQEKKDLISFLKKYCHKIKVICYVRPPQSYAYSAFCEVIKDGNIVKKIPLRFKEKLQAFVDDKFIDLDVRVFAKEKLLNGDVVDDFCKSLNLNISAIKKITSNVSFSESALKLIYTFLSNNPCIKGDEITFTSNKQFLKKISDLYSDGPKIKEEYFSCLVDWEETSYLRDNFGIKFEDKDSFKKKSFKQLHNYLSSLDDIDISKIDEELAKRKIFGNFIDVNAKLNRLFYEYITEATTFSKGKIESEKLNNALAIGAIFRNEFEYILEWLAWHQMAGFDNFYIADNGSIDGSRELLEALSDAKQINMIYQPTFKNISEGNAQLKAYARISQLFLDNVEAILFIDADEFLTHESMIDGAEYRLLVDLFNNPKIAMVGINWRMFGSSGHIKQSSDLVIERFKAFKEDIINQNNIEPNENKSIKSISRIKFTVKILPHFSIFLGDKLLINPLGNTLNFINDNGLTKIYEWSSVCISPIRINHYVIKSLDEFVRKKQKRGHPNREVLSESWFKAHDFHGGHFYFPEKKIERLKVRIEKLNEAINKTSFNESLRGLIDTNNQEEISGWLVNEKGKSKNLKVNIFVNSIYQGFAKVGFYRHDLKEKKISIDGFSGFRWTHPQTLKNGDKVEVYVYANRYKFTINASIEIGLDSKGQ